MNGVRDGGLLEHLQAEHHKLNLALSAIRRRMDDTVVDSLRALRTELRSHFAQEETEGCLEDAGARCPSAAPRLKALKSDHDDLLCSLDELIQVATEDEAPPEAMSSRLESLSQRLHDHEAAESRLLQYALGGDTSEYDVEGND